MGKYRNNICSWLICLIVSAITAACSHEVDSLFTLTAAERIDRAVSDYSAYLTSSPEGWVMEYYPTNSVNHTTGRGYLIVLDFMNDGSAVMTMKNSASDYKALRDTSVWEIRKDNGPVLSFPTYNSCLHRFSDPSYRELGTGMGGDYEFVLADTATESRSVMMKGKKRGVYVRMSQLAEGNHERYIDGVEAFKDSLFPYDAVNYNLLSTGNAVYRVDSICGGIPNIYPVDGDPVANEKRAPYLITLHKDGYHLRFRDVLHLGADDVQELVFDPDRNCFAAGDNSGKVTLKAPDAVAFFDETVRNGLGWSMKLSEDAMCAQLYSIYKRLLSQMVAQRDKYELESWYCTIHDAQSEDAILSVYVTFRKNRNTRIKVRYDYDYSVGSGVVSMKNPVPVGSQSESVLSVFTAFDELLKTVAGDYSICSVKSCFCLNSLKWNQAGDSIWFRFDIEK